MPDDGLASRSARARGSGPYESTVPAALASGAGLTLALPGEVAADVADAETALAAFAAAARCAAATGMRLVDALSAQLEADRERLAGVRRHALAWKVLPLLVSRPIVNAVYLQQQPGFPAMTAQRVLAQLSDSGALREATSRSRHRVWQHSRILTVLDDHAAAVRRES